jgi:hypothetical protein
MDISNITNGTLNNGTNSSTSTTKNETNSSQSVVNGSEGNATNYS